jgi:hypothetical protein
MTEEEKQRLVSWAAETISLLEAMSDLEYETVKMQNKLILEHITDKEVLMKYCQDSILYTMHKEHLADLLIDCDKRYAYDR